MFALQWASGLLRALCPHAKRCLGAGFDFGVLWQPVSVEELEDRDDTLCTIL